MPTSASISTICSRPPTAGWSGCGEAKKRPGPSCPSRTPLKRYLPLLLVFLAAFFGIAWILIRFTDSNVPWLDSFTTALSIIGMWMLARKYVEQWWAWIVVDVVCCGLYIYKELYFTSALYGLYSIIAIFGYFKWKQMMHYESK